MGDIGCKKCGGPHYSDFCTAHLEKQRDPLLNSTPNPGAVSNSPGAHPTASEVMAKEFARQQASAMMQQAQVYPAAKAVRDTCGVRFDILDPEFLLIMAKIAHYGTEHYGDYNWHKSRLSGNEGPINHLEKHINKYKRGEDYDHPEVGSSKSIHLAAIAFNAMMEFWYEGHPEVKP